MQAPGSEIGSRFGPYELRSLLGRGGMGEVYEAYDTVKDRVVALKLLAGDLVGDPEYQIRFRRESQAAARLAEPHIIPIHDWGVIEGRLFIDMRLVPGTDLRTILQSGGPLSPQRAVTVLEQIAAALDAAHVDGLVHRDVKPANILVTDADFAYLADFGIAHYEGESSVTKAGVAIGSYTYMAPERFDRAPVTPRADIYSLACVLHECLTGAVPFDAPSIGMLIRAHLAEPPPRASVQRTGLPAAFDDVIACGMAKDPHDRFATATELAVAARTALNSPPRPPHSAMPPAPTSGELPATPVSPVDSSPPTGGIPTLVVRIPNLDDDGTPDPTTTLPAIIPGDPTSVRPTEFHFTPLTEEQAEPEAPNPGIRPFPDAHLYQQEQLHPAVDPALHPDAAPATGGMPVADFYPPDQATRIYGKEQVPGPSAEDATRVFDPVESVPPVGPDGDATTRAYRPGAHGAAPAHPSAGRARGAEGDASGEYAYMSGEHTRGPEDRAYVSGELDYRRADPAYVPGEHGYAVGDNAYAAEPPGHLAHDNGYAPGADGYAAGDDGYAPGANGYAAGDNGYPPGADGYPAGADDYPPGAGGYPVDDNRYGPGPDGYASRESGYEPREPAYGPEETTRLNAAGPGGPGSRPDEYGHHPGAPGYPAGDSRTSTGDWWTAERQDEHDEPHQPGPVAPGPSGLFGYGGAGPEPVAPAPDPYAAAYEAGYRDSYLANAARPPEGDSAGRRSRLFPILAGAGGFVVVALIALLAVNFLGSGDDSTTAADSTGAATTAAARSSVPATSAPTRTSTATTTTEADLPSAATPCTTASTGSGPYGSSAAGTSVTSCEFAEAVRQAYLDPGVVSAEGEPVSIEATSPVTGQAYTLECVAQDGLVTCRGGNNAVVYLY
ncbi:protein kinase domain-containing protein [Nocardia sp. CA-290969]|uniref:serine/threonine-protein kinase n=1 Tax=Nocardia sp. CA-290969 TaxID=3239986 RepID=UPI003D8CEC65